MSAAIGESCHKFRRETLGPSGGWLASVVVGLSLKTGIYDYTILATIFMFSFIILRTASCESAFVLALAYDLVIPFQYQNAQCHLKELERYWPRFVTGTMIEAGCYLVLFPDLFNLVVIVKTSVLLVLWMRGKKQWPLVFPTKTQSVQPPQNEPIPTNPPEQTEEPTHQPHPSSSSSKVTPEYLAFVKKELEKVKGKNALDADEIQDKLTGLQYPKEDRKRKNAEESLKKRGIPTFKVWKAAQGAMSPVGSQRQDSNTSGPNGAPERVMGTKDRYTERELRPVNQKCKDKNMPDDVRRALMQRLLKPFDDPDFNVAKKEIEAAGVKLPPVGGESNEARKAAAAAAVAGGEAAGQSQTTNPVEPVPGPPPDTKPKSTDIKYTPLTPEDVDKLKADLANAGASIPHDKVIPPLLAGPTHPEFHPRLNYLRYKGINTRKWVPIAANTTKYRLPDSVIDGCIDLIEDIPNVRSDVKTTLIEDLTSCHDTLAGLNASIKKISNVGLFSLKTVPEENGDTYKAKVSPGGHMWYEYLQRMHSAKEGGPEAVSMLESTYDYLCDPFNKPNSKSDKQTISWWQVMNQRWDMFESERRDEKDNDWIVGSAGLPVEEILGYRKQLEDLGAYSNDVLDVIVRLIKYSSTAEEGRAEFKRLMDQSVTMKGQVSVAQKYGKYTKEARKYDKHIKATEEREAKERAKAAAAAS